MDENKWRKFQRSIEGLEYARKSLEELIADYRVPERDELRFLSYNFDFYDYNCLKTDLNNACKAFNRLMAAVLTNEDRLENEED